VTLLERDRELDALGRALHVARAGTGTGLAVSGEAGAGKTVLVAAACAGATGLRVLRTRCDPLDTPRPLGPFRDLTAHLGQLGQLGQDQPLAAVCERLYAAIAAEPSVLVVEDLHWVDAASADVLRFLARRLEAAPCALVLTYRDHEIGLRHPARALLGDVAALDTFSTLHLRPLSLQGVTRLAEGTGLDPEQVHDVTGGNPFFVAEVLRDPERPLPTNVRDAVLARVASIDTADLEVLQLAATAPDRLDDRVLPQLGVELPTLRRLWDTGLLDRDERGLVFRHELARLAVESTIPAGGEARLHARLLEALERVEPRDPSVLTHHAVAAADAARAALYADAAAQEAARGGAHAEAVAFLRIAVDHLGPDRPHDRARLLSQLGFEEYMISQLDSALESVRATFPLWREVGDTAGLSAAHASCAVFEYYNAHRRQAEDHADRAATLAGDRFAVAYGGARATRAYLAYHRSDYPLVEEYRSEAARIAETTGDEMLELRTRLVGGATDLARDVPGARARFVSLIEDARAAGFDEVASTGYSTIAYLDVEQRRLANAERVLEESLAFTIERDIPICNHWQTAVRSRLRHLEGRWDAALEDADDVLLRRGMPVATFWPHVVRGLVALRRGDDGGDHLEAAWELADRLDEPMRRLAALSALAESMWVSGTPDERVVRLAPALLSDTAGQATGWSVGELAVWLRRLGIDHSVSPDDVAEPYRASLAGRHLDAAAWWGRTRAVVDEALCQTDSDDLEQRLAGVERLELHGAVALADRIRRILRDEGVVQLPPRPRASTRANPAGLTNRQLDVAKLVARGLTNAEIADRLFISPKTTDHHVSAVLTKLGIPSRRAVIVQASELGLA
jgi:DNA-binding CsgD family transcriptional regulator